MSKVIILTADNWEEEVARSILPVLVDFWAPWCGACRNFAPVLERIANQLGGEAIVAKINTDDGKELSRRYVIRALPTIILFRYGIEAARVIGGRSESYFVELVRRDVSEPYSATYIDQE